MASSPVAGDAGPESTVVRGWTPPAALQDAAWPEPSSSSGHPGGREGGLGGATPAQPLWPPPGRVLGVGSGGEIGGGCFWGRKAQQRGPCHVECSPGPHHRPAGWAAHLGPARTGAEPRARLLPSAPPSHTRRHRQGRRRVTCLVSPPLLSDFQDVVTMEGAALERTGASKA